MQHLTKIQLPYQIDTTQLVSQIVDYPWLIWFDSGYPFCQLNHLDIITACPFIQVIGYRQYTKVKTRHTSYCVLQEPLTVLQSLLKKFQHSPEPYPFYGGAAGYLSYDLGAHYEDLPQTTENDLQIPDCCFGIYDWALTVNHRTQETMLLSPMNDMSDTQKLFADIQQRLNDEPKPAHHELATKFQANLTKQAYLEKFSKVHEYILAGDCYQVNLAQRFHATITGDSFSAYQRLRASNPAPFGAFARTPYLDILSLSPERFIEVKSNQVRTQPIKGTAPRKSDPKTDALMAEQLQSSEKDKAENLMIVDLLRNDLSKTCEPNSIQVPKLYALESFPNVHHLVSTVQATLQKPYDAIDCLRACFPGGSITGTPKIRAMQIIDELEPHARGLYCGSVGYINLHGDMDTNIAIRTLQRINNQIYAYAGGGLVADSDANAEYQETFDKINFVIETLS